MQIHFSLFAFGSALASAFWLLSGCSPKAEVKATPQQSQLSESKFKCPARIKASKIMPGVTEAMLDPNYWIEQMGDLADKPLLSTQQTLKFNQTLRYDPQGQPRPVDLQTPLSKDLALSELGTRVKYMQAKLEQGEYISEHGDALERTAKATTFDTYQPVLHVALDGTPIYCGPVPGTITSRHGDPRYNRNSCGWARPQEPIEILGRIPNGLRWVRTSFTMGFIRNDAKLSKPVPKNLQPHYRAFQRAKLNGELKLPNGQTLFPKLDHLVSVNREQTQAFVALEANFETISLPNPSLTPTLSSAPVTRKDVLLEAFKRRDRPYGWGGQNGGRDCSRFLMDTLRTFGLALPRTSYEQSQASYQSIDLPQQADQKARYQALDQAFAQGLVLAYFPGHIMLYLGKDEHGDPKMLHAFGEYLRPCEGSETETVVEVDRIAVSDLSLGKGTSRRAFIERLTKLVIIGPDSLIKADSRPSLPSH